METFFAVAAPGLEALTANELVCLKLLPEGSRQSAVEEGGVTFKGNLWELYQANLHLRTASRILVRLGDFFAAGFAELRKKASRLPWEKYIITKQRISLAVTCRKSRLYHSGGVAERVFAAIQDRLGGSIEMVKTKEEAGGDEKTAQLIVVRLLNDHVSISIDSSGELLHRRGYRLATAKAPLRETLAAAMLIASGWDSGAPLIDPFCGSGTIAIEAALIAAGRPPGCASPQMPRKFAFMNWPGFDKQLWQKALRLCSENTNPKHPPILASDRDKGAIQIAIANAERAGVADQITFTQKAVSAIEPPAGPGWVVTNPPYGQRISSSADLRNLYAQLGNVLRSKCPGWHVGILCNDIKLISQTRLSLDTSFSTINGGIPVRLARGKVFENPT